MDVGVVDVQTTEAGRRVFRQHEIDFVINDPTGKLYVQSAFNIDDPVRRAALRLCGHCIALWPQL